MMTTGFDDMDANLAYQANRVLAVLSKMFNLAERWGLRADGSNRCRHVEKFGERKRERMLTGSELSRLGEALAGYEGSPIVVGAVKLLVFTGARLGEILGLRWDWINLEKPWRAIRVTAGLDDVRLHDLRHAFASIAASSGLGLPIIGKILGHTQPR